jgi:hypothetical protein
VPLRLYPAKSGAFPSNERSRVDCAGSEAVTAALTKDSALGYIIDQSTLPVFQQNWWLEIARRTGSYHEARVFKNRVLVGSLPYAVRRTKIGLRWGAAPDWSHLGGPVVSQSLSDAEKSDVLGQLIAQLPANISYGFVCSPYTNDAGLMRRAFASAGFAYFTETTCCQSPSQADVLGRLNRKHRLHLEAARRRLDVVELRADEFIDFYSMNLADSALAARLPLETARALIARGRMGDAPQVRVIAARRKTSGAPLDAAIACAWDKRRYYYWMSTRRRHSVNGQHDVSHPDAIKLLIVSAMAHAESLGLVFDTDGCSTPGSQKLYNEILRIPNEEFRDVFERITRLQRWYITQQQRLDKSAAIRYAKRRLRLVPSVWVPERMPSSPNC